MEDQPENNKPCDCQNYCHSGQPPILRHHYACNKYRPISEMLEIITELINGIQSWAADEDGVHPDCWQAYSRAKICIGEVDHIQKQIEAEQETTSEERAVLHHLTNGSTVPPVSQASPKLPEQNNNGVR